MSELTPEEEEETKRRARATFQAQATTPDQSPNLALLRAAPGQTTGVNMMPPPLPPAVAALPDEAPPVALPAPSSPPSPPPVSTEPSIPAPIVSPVASSPAALPRSPGGGGSSADGRLRKDLDASVSESTRAAGKVGDAKIAQAGAASEVAKDDATAKDRAAQERFQAQQIATSEAARLTAKADTEDAKYKAMGFKDFWADKTTGARVLGALSMAFGAAGASLTGGPNYAMEIIDKTIDRDYQRQKDAILKQKDVVSEARGIAKDAKAEKLLSLEAWRKAAYEATEAQGRAMLAKMGPGAAEADKASTIASVHEKAQESRLALEKGIATISNTRADTALKGAEIGKVKAETTKDLAQAAAAGQAKDSEKGIKDARQRAMLVTGLEDQDKIVRELEGHGVRLSEKDLQKIQDNRTYLAAAQHGDKSALGALGIVYARKWGSVPRSEFDGLTEPQKRLAGAYSQITQKAALLNAGAMTTEAISHAANAVDLLAPNQGPEEHARRKTYIRTDLIGANKGMVPGMVDKARSGAEAVQSNAPSASGSFGGAQRLRLKDGRTATLGEDGLYHAD